MRTLKLIWVLVIFQSPAFAQEMNGICESLVSLTCAPGTHDDGTGFSRRDTVTSSLEDSFEKQRESVRQSMAKTLEGPPNSHYRRQAIYAFGLKDSPNCKSEEASAVAKCNADVTEGLTDFARKEITGVSRNDFQKYSLPALMFLKNNQIFASAINNLHPSITKPLERPEIEQKAQDKIYPQIKKLIMQRLENLPLKDTAKKYLISKIDGVQFGGTDCTDKDKPLAKTFISNAYYQDIRMSLKICKGSFVNSTSEFEIAYTIAHELTHAIDPCNIQNLGDATYNYPPSPDVKKMDVNYPIPGLLTCLRSEKSVAAQVNTETDSDKLKGKIDSGKNITPKKVKKAPEPHSYCQGKDQIGESVSDWMAAEILPKYIETNFPNLTKEQWQTGISNVWRNDCTPPDPKEKAFDVHPPTTSRIDALLLTQPNIRAKIGCPVKHTKYAYCDPVHSSDSGKQESTSSRKGQR